MQTKNTLPSPLVLTLRRNLNKTLNKLLDRSRLSEAFSELLIFAENKLVARSIILRHNSLKLAAEEAGFLRLHIFCRGKLLLSQEVRERYSEADFRKLLQVEVMNRICPPGCVAYRANNTLFIECPSKHAQKEVWEIVCKIARVCASLITEQRISITNTRGGNPISACTATLKRRHRGGAQ